jgi:hypothetical protein
MLCILLVSCRDPTLRPVCLLVKHRIRRVHMAGNAVILLQLDKLYAIQAKYTSNAIVLRERK